MTDTGSTGSAPQYSLVLPAHNEHELLGSTVEHLVEGMGERRLTYEVIIIENGSSDDTLAIARELAGRFPVVRVLTQPVGDYGAALSAGFRDATGDVVVNFDVDYYDLGFVDVAGELVRSEGVDIVVASKRSPEADDQRSLLRRVLTFGFTTMLRIMVHLPVSDAHGIKAMRRSSVAPLAAQCVLTGSMYDVELVCRAGRAGLVIRELPATVVELRPVRSSVWRRTLEGFVLMIRLRRVLRQKG